MLEYKTAIRKTTEFISHVIHETNDEKYVASISAALAWLLSEVYSVDSDNIVNSLAANLKAFEKAKGIDPICVPCKVEEYEDLNRAKMLFNNNAFSIVNFIPSEGSVTSLLSMMFRSHALPNEEPVRVYFTSGEFLNSLSKTNTFETNAVVASIMCSQEVEYLPGLIEVKNLIEKMDDKCFWYQDVIDASVFDAAL